MKPMTLEQLESVVREAKRRLQLMREIRETERLLVLESLDANMSTDYQFVFKTGLALVCQTFEVPEEHLLSRSRTDRVALPRMLLMWLCRELTDAGPSKIARSFNKDHGTVLHALKAVKDRMATDTKFKESANSIRSRIHEVLNQQKTEGN